MAQVHEHQMRMMEMVQQQQQQQQQQWAASMEAAWAAAPTPSLDNNIGAPAWMAPAGDVAAAADHWQLPLLANDVIGAAVASASESIVRCLLTHEQVPAAHVHSSIDLPPPLQQLPQHVKAAFFRRATMLARHAGEALPAATDCKISPNTSCSTSSSSSSSSSLVLLLFQAPDLSMLSVSSATAWPQALASTLVSITSFLSQRHTLRFPAHSAGRCGMAVEGGCNQHDGGRLRGDEAPGACQCALPHVSPQRAMGSCRRQLGRARGSSAAARTGA
jgi:hypothetical protein